MKGVILAGGTGSRLYPATKITNKHCLPIGNRLMLEYPLETLKKLGISDIMIVVGGNNTGDIVEYFGDGNKFGVKLSYKYQTEPNGIAGAVALTENFIGEENFLVCLGDNYFDMDIDLQDHDTLCSIFIKEVADPERFGVAIFENNKVVGVVEKPIEAPSNFALTGLYKFTPDVFNVIRTLRPSDRGELEITHAIDYYFANNPEKIDYNIVEGYWSDMGTWATYLKVSNHVINKK